MRNNSTSNSNRDVAPDIPLDDDDYIRPNNIHKITKRKRKPYKPSKRELVEQEEEEEEEEEEESIQIDKDWRELMRKFDNELKSIRPMGQKRSKLTQHTATSASSSSKNSFFDTSSDSVDNTHVFSQVNSTITKIDNHLQQTQQFQQTIKKFEAQQFKLQSLSSSSSSSSPPLLVVTAPLVYKSSPGDKPRSCGLCFHRAHHTDRPLLHLACNSGPYLHLFHPDCLFSSCSNLESNEYPCPICQTPHSLPQLMAVIKHLFSHVISPQSSTPLEFYVSSSMSVSWQDRTRPIEHWYLTEYHERQCMSVIPGLSPECVTWFNQFATVPYQECLTLGLKAVPFSFFYTSDTQATSSSDTTSSDAANSSDASNSSNASNSIDAANSSNASYSSGNSQSRSEKSSQSVSANIRSQHSDHLCAICLDAYPSPIMVNFFCHQTVMTDCQRCNRLGQHCWQHLHQKIPHRMHAQCLASWLQQLKIHDRDRNNEFTFRKRISDPAISANLFKQLWTSQRLMIEPLRDDAFLKRRIQHNAKSKRQTGQDDDYDVEFKRKSAPNDVKQKEHKEHREIFADLREKSQEQLQTNTLKVNDKIKESQESHMFDVFECLLCHVPYQRSVLEDTLTWINTMIEAHNKHPMAEKKITECEFRNRKK